MELIDTHCHLTGKTRDYLEQVIENAENANVKRMVCIGASGGVESAGLAVELSENYSNIWATIGIHPHDAGDWTSVKEIEQFADHPRVVAIGETGLDFFRDWAPKENQVKLFENTIALARDIKKPLVIHCREARKETFAILKEQKADLIGGVFHCYSEDAEFAKRLLDFNFKVSLTGSLTFKKALALQETAKVIPLTQIMLETDTPYMAPEPYRGGESEPAHVREVAVMLAALKAISVEEVAEATTNTALEFFKIK
jgi:TatD DNase family protein